MQVQRTNSDTVREGTLKKSRAFGQDLTNQHREHASQNARVKETHFDIVKPKLVVINDEHVMPRGADKIDSTPSTSAVKEESPSLERQSTMEEEHAEADDDMSVNDEDEEEGTEKSMDNSAAHVNAEMIVIKEQQLAPWDVDTRDEDVYVTEYVDAIMQHLQDDEANPLNDCVIQGEFDFMDAFQKDVNQRMRTVLVDWLIDVHRKFKLLPSTYCLGINMLDRYMAKRQLHRRKLQLAGCTCLWIASKYHEIYAPEMDDFVYISDNAFEASDLMEMEIEILKTLSFTLTVPTVLNYAQRYGKISSFYLKKECEIKIIKDLIMYCIEHCLLSYDLCRKLPSLLGAASFVYSCISTKVFSTSTFEKDNLESVIGYELKQLIPVMTQIHFTLKNAKKSKYKALYKKYCNHKFSNISKLNFAKLHTSFLRTSEDSE